MNWFKLAKLAVLGILITSVELATAAPSAVSRPTYGSLPEAITGQPKPATSGTPKIEHVRNGKVIATYTRLGGGDSKPDNTDGHDNSVGPFRKTRYLQYLEGDIFLVYPAVYEGGDQQIHIGSMFANDADYRAGKWARPKNITIRGVTVNGFRPVIRNPSTGASGMGQALVYISQAENITIENIDISDSPTGGNLGKAGLYLVDYRNVTLRNMRITGFKQHEQNGIFGASGASGTLRLEGVELADNGGGGGHQHNAYINAGDGPGAADFTVHATDCYFHDSFYGHLFKSRAQNNIFERNYFKGGTGTPGKPAESYLLDIPEGGRLVVRDNVFVKGFSGDGSNGAALTYAVEVGVPGARDFDTQRPWSVTVENNTFIALTETYDNAGHKNATFFFNRKAPVPDNARSITKNRFAGYKPNATDIANGFYGTGYELLRSVPSEVRK